MGKIKALVTEMGYKGAEEFLARIRDNIKRNKIYFAQIILQLLLSCS